MWSKDNELWDKALKKGIEAYSAIIDSFEKLGNELSKTNNIENDNN